MASFDEFYESLPEDSNKRGEYFEKVFVPWFLRTDPEWSSQVQQVWLWDDYPHRWGKDCGIDLVYEDTQGKHWAVQSKCVSHDREISKAEIDSFLSESSDSRIHGRLLIASTDGIGKYAQQVIDRQEKQVVCFLLEHFKHSAVEFPSKPEDLSTGQRKEKRTPRPHQQEAIKNVVEGFQKEDRGQLLMACGTGKTLTSLWIMEALNAKRTLVLVPSLGLLSQTLREWTATSKEEFNWICVCSDKSVAKQDKTTDSMIERVSGLGVPVTSDPKDIQDFLEKEEGGVVFSTYQSSELVTESQKNPATPGFDITFADEAHRCTGKISSAFACVLDSERIRSDKRLFMTATPRVLSKQIKKKADDENIDLACMDDVSQFGEIFHQLNFSEAIHKELLSDYKVVIVGVDDPTVEAKILHREIVQTENELEIDTETLANHIALAKAIKDYDLSRLITFHSRVKSAKKFSEDHPSIQEWMPEDSKTSKILICSHASGEMPTKSRNLAINKLRHINDNEVGILTNARCLSEGVDVPTLDGIVFMDPKRSQVDIIQALGRAIRKSINKTDGYIILPVYLGDTKNIEESILQSRFQEIWKIILALKSQDDSLRVELDQLRVELGRNNYSKKPIQGPMKIIFDLPSRVSTSFSDSISTLLVQETTENWLEKYGNLVQHMEDNENSIPERSHHTLGPWCNTQRNWYKQGILTPERIQLLESINGWNWDPREEQWTLMLDKFREFNKPDNALSTDEIKKVKTWIGEQRTSYKRNKIPKYRIALLEEIDGWEWDSLSAEWEKKFARLAEYVEINGHARVPRSHPELGTFVEVNRRNYRINKIEPKRKQRLESLNGWVWNKKEEVWEETYTELKNYLNADKDNYPSPSHQTLGRWISAQRTAYRKGNLSQKRVKKLETIEKWCWDDNGRKEEDWMNRFTSLKNHLKKNPNSTPNMGIEEHAQWIRSQKRMKKENKLSESKINLLESLRDWKW
ncbi:Helicase associated domain protein [Synechococcus sp. A10-1-5-1]|uniref:DEAD/DEAH box helicase n=1 Tax=Synechococcus sp. A10-1-5-1 TaxID=2936507 RepID=UPI0020008D91|nr:DEAD/DEAH box helicase [Synechococcus sp. A10-1-5-1]UPM51150.1 Helicase associated domain protein [Synechococcus sp. A10-1-5-1]